MSYSFLQLSNRLRKRLKELRQAKGLKQSEVAEFLDMSTQQYQWLESGPNRNPSLKTLYRLALVFDTDLRDLLPSIYEASAKGVEAGEPPPQSPRRKKRGPAEPGP